MQEPVVAIYSVHLGRWLVGSRPRDWLIAHRVEEVVPLLDAVDYQVEQQGRVAIGYVAYEAAPAFDRAMRVHEPRTYPLAAFALFRPEMLRYPHFLDTQNPKTESPLQLEQELDADTYTAGLTQIQECLRAGEVYQVNFTYRLRGRFSGHPWTWFLSRIPSNNPAYSAYLKVGNLAVCSFSPELFFLRTGERIVCEPMKGTWQRGLSIQEDHRFADLLYRSAKNRAENLMIVDMVRNDLARIALPGSVWVPALWEVKRFRTVWQMTSTVVAKTRAGLHDLFSALFPAASITGAPKIRSMELIHRLEKSPRGVYCGAVGVVLPGRRSQFNVAIRTAVMNVKAQCLTYGVGGGIVLDSSWQNEWAESRLKTRVLWENHPTFRLLETLLWEREGGYFLLRYHLARLYQSARHFGFRCSVSEVLVALQQQARCLLNSGEAACVLRLLLDARGQVTLQRRPCPSHADRPVSLALASRPVNANWPWLYHKTTHRRFYQQVRLDHPHADDILLWNERGELTESTIANLVVKIKGCFYTPPVFCGLLGGTYRRWLLEQGRIEERILQLQDLQRAESIYLINSVRRWYPARLVNMQPTSPSAALALPEKSR